MAPRASGQTTAERHIGARCGARQAEGWRSRRAWGSCSSQSVHGSRAAGTRRMRRALIRIYAGRGAYLSSAVSLRAALASVVRGTAARKAITLLETEERASQVQERLVGALQ